MKSVSGWEIDNVWTPHMREEVIDGIDPTDVLLRIEEELQIEGFELDNSQRTYLLYAGADVARGV